MKSACACFCHFYLRKLFCQLLLLAEKYSHQRTTRMKPIHHWRYLKMITFARIIIKELRTCLQNCVRHWHNIYMCLFKSFYFTLKHYFLILSSKITTKMWFVLLTWNLLTSDFLLLSYISIRPLYLDAIIIVSYIVLLYYTR